MNDLNTKFLYNMKLQVKTNNFNQITIFLFRVTPALWIVEYMQQLN